MWHEPNHISFAELRVHLELRGKIREDQFLLQERAPVVSVIFDSRWSRTTPELVLQITEHYNKTLQVGNVVAGVFELPVLKRRGCQRQSGIRAQ